MSCDVRPRKEYPGFSPGISGKAQASSMPKHGTSRHIGGGRCGAVAAASKTTAPVARCGLSRHATAGVRRHAAKGQGVAHRPHFESVLFVDISFDAHEMHSERHSEKLAGRRPHGGGAFDGPLMDYFACTVQPALPTIRIESRCAMILRKLPQIAVASACFMLSTGLIIFHILAGSTGYGGMRTECVKETGLIYVKNGRHL